MDGGMDGGIGEWMNGFKFKQKQITQIAINYGGTHLKSQHLEGG